VIIASPRARRRARIEIVPLIDVIFFLLATFIMVSLSMAKTRGISVNLPAAMTGVFDARASDSTITVSKAGEVFFNKTKLSLYELELRLRSLKVTEGDPKIVLRGDEHAHFGVAVSVLDLARRIGIVRISIDTKAVQQ
jgi:biopolymer transport protein ExbD